MEIYEGFLMLADGLSANIFFLELLLLLMLLSANFGGYFNFYNYLWIYWLLSLAFLRYYYLNLFSSRYSYFNGNCPLKIILEF